MVTIQPLRATSKAPLHRSELASAIAAAAEATDKAEAARAAVTRLRAIVEDAEERLASASAEVAATRDAHVARLTSAVTAGDALIPDRSLREARGRELEAQDNVEAARSALAIAEEAVAEPEYAERKAQEHLSAAANAVLASDAVRLLDEAKVVQDDLVRRRVVLRFLLHEVGIAEPEREAVRSFLQNSELPRTFGSVGFVDWNNILKNKVASF